jgi:hypothetical protein
MVATPGYTFKRMRIDDDLREELRQRGSVDPRLYWAALPDGMYLRVLLDDQVEKPRTRAVSMSVGGERAPRAGRPLRSVNAAQLAAVVTYFCRGWTDLETMSQSHVVILCGTVTGNYQPPG